MTLDMMEAELAKAMSDGLSKFVGETISDKTNEAIKKTATKIYYEYMKNVPIEFRKKYAIPDYRIMSAKFVDGQILVYPVYG